MSGVKYLIVTADDLGLTKSINEGISRACKEGIVNSVSVIPTGEAFEDALGVIKDLGLKEIGAHLALTETKPLLNSSKVYGSHRQLFVDLISRRADLSGIRAEFSAQLKLLKRSGVRITHINSHEHIHMMPEILNIFISLAKEFDIPAIRYPRKDRPARPLAAGDIYKKAILSYFSSKTKGIFDRSGLAYTDSFLGLLDAGKLKMGILIDILKALSDGVTELVCHPGFLSPEVMEKYKWHDGAEEELFALTDDRIKKAIKDNHIQLITYGELPSVRGAKGL